MDNWLKCWFCSDLWIQNPGERLISSIIACVSECCKIQLEQQYLASWPWTTSLELISFGCRQETGYFGHSWIWTIPQNHPLIKDDNPGSSKGSARYSMSFLTLETSISFYGDNFLFATSPKTRKLEKMHLPILSPLYLVEIWPTASPYAHPFFGCENPWNSQNILACFVAGSSLTASRWPLRAAQDNGVSLWRSKALTFRVPRVGETKMIQKKW